MELPGQGWHSAGDDGRLRRFPDPSPPPPHARDADGLLGEAALVRRRDELLWELHTTQVRLDMILRELVETEYAMAARSAPARQWPVPTGPWSQDPWHRRASSATAWDDAHPLQPSTCSEHPPRSCRSPAAVRPPPVYPHVERLPSPLATSGYPQYCRSQSKQTRTDEALVPGVANTGVRSMGSEFFRQVTPEHEDAVAGGRKSDLEDGNANGNKSSRQRKAAETTMVDLNNDPGSHRPEGQDNAAFKQRLEFSEIAPEQPWLGSDTKQLQECRSPGATVHRMINYTELCQAPSKQTQADKSVVSDARPIRSAGGEVAPGGRWDIGMDPKVDVEKAEELALENQIDEPVQSPHGYIPAGQGNSAYSEQKGRELCEPQPGSDAKQQQECRSSGATVHLMSRYLELCPLPRKRTQVEETLPTVANAIIRPALSMSFGEEVAAVHERDTGEEPKVDVENDHGVRSFYENRNQSSCQRKAVEPVMGAQIDKPLQQPSQSKLASQENAAYNEQTRIEISELTPERTSSGLKRRLTVAAPLAKKQKPVGESSGTVNPTRQRYLDEYPAGQLHQSNVEALQARIKPPEFNIKALPGQGNSAKNWEPVRWDGKENLAENRGSEDRPEPAARRWMCRICNANCSSASNFREHLGGRRHRENTEVILADFSNSYTRMEADSGKGAYYCKVCSVRCAGDMVMASHLIGRRHREALQD